MDAETQSSMLSDYLHGRLNAAQCKVVEDLLLKDADASAEYEFLKQVRETLVVPVPDESHSDGFDALMTRIRQELPSQSETGTWLTSIRPQVRDADAVPGFMSRALAWLLRPSMSYAVTGSIFIAQLAVLAVVFQSSPDETRFSDMRTQSTVPPVAGPFIRVSLKPDAKEADIRFLMISLGATIVGGPTQLGDYFVFVAPARTDLVAQQMRQSQIIDQANVIATLPPLKE